MFAIKFNGKYYWCGYNKVDTQIRKAVIYKTRKIAEKVLKDDLVPNFWFRLLEDQAGKLLTSEIVEVGLEEKWRVSYNIHVS